jgi:hypothetical protein
MGRREPNTSVVIENYIIVVGDSAGTTCPALASEDEKPLPAETEGAGRGD